MKTKQPVHFSSSPLERLLANHGQRCLLGHQEEAGFYVAQQKQVIQTQAIHGTGMFTHGPLLNHPDPNGSINMPVRWMVWERGPSVQAAQAISHAAWPKSPMAAAKEPALVGKSNEVPRNFRGFFVIGREGCKVRLRRLRNRFRDWRSPGDGQLTAVIAGLCLYCVPVILHPRREPLGLRRSVQLVWMGFKNYQKYLLNGANTSLHSANFTPQQPTAPTCTPSPLVRRSS